MKNILSSLNESEKRRILEMHYRASLRQYLMEQDPNQTPDQTDVTTGETTKPNEVNLTADLQALQTAISTFNTAMTTVYGKDPGFTATSYGDMKDNNSYIHITYPKGQDTFGSKAPYGIVGINILRGDYKYPNNALAGTLFNVSGNEDKIPNKFAMFAYYSATNKSAEDWVKYMNSKKYSTAIAPAQALFNTVDPIFKKLIGYKGYKITTTSPDLIISKPTETASTTTTTTSS